MKGLFNFYLHSLMDSYAQERLSQLVIKLRGEKSQRRFAVILGVSYAAVRSWEQCESMPGISSLQKLADYTDQTIEELLDYLNGGKDKSNIEHFAKAKVAEEVLQQVLNLSALERNRLMKMMLDLDWSEQQINRFMRQMIGKKQLSQQNIEKLFLPQIANLPKKAISRFAKLLIEKLEQS